MEQYLNENQVNTQENQPPSFLSGIFQTIRQSKMSLVLFIFVGIVFVFSIFIIILAIISRPKSPTPSPTPTSQSQNYNPSPVVDDTSSWKEYVGINQIGLNFRISIKYPNEWFVNPQSPNYIVFTERGTQYKIRFNEKDLGLPPDPSIVCTDQNNVSLGKNTADEKICKSGGNIILFAANIANGQTKTNIIFEVPPVNQDKYLKIFGQMLSTFKTLPPLPRTNQISNINQSNVSRESTDSATNPATNNTGPTP